MESIISTLVNRFDRGTLTRRELIQGLTMLAAGGAARAAAAQDAAVKTVKIDHISIQVRDLPRSIRFYQTLFGLQQVSEDKPNEIVRLGATDKTLVSLHHKAHGHRGSLCDCCRRLRPRRGNTEAQAARDKSGTGHRCRISRQGSGRYQRSDRRSVIGHSVSK